MKDQTGILCNKCHLRPITHVEEKLCKQCYKKADTNPRKDMGICIRCTIRPVSHLKRRLCAPCYRYLYQNNDLDSLNAVTGHELEFTNNFFSHINWIHQPATFKFSGVYYTPDFYDNERNVFIEVVGSRQAYHANKHKYTLFRKSFPHIIFEIRKPNGEILNEKKIRLDWS